MQPENSLELKNYQLTNIIYKIHKLDRSPVHNCIYIIFVVYFIINYIAIIFALNSKRFIKMFSLFFEMQSIDNSKIRVK